MQLVLRASKTRTVDEVAVINEYCTSSEFKEIIEKQTIWRERIFIAMTVAYKTHISRLSFLRYNMQRFIFA